VRTARVLKHADWFGSLASCEAVTHGELISRELACGHVSHCEGTPDISWGLQGCAVGLHSRW